MKIRIFSIIFSFCFLSHFILAQSYLNYDFYYHRCEWSVDPAKRFISGKVSTYFKSLSDTSSSICFDLSSSLNVDSVVYYNSSLKWNHNNDRLYIFLTDNSIFRTIDSIEIRYHGVPVEDNFGGFAQSEHEKVPIIWTLSEPYSAKDWWPCKQTLNDKIDSIDNFIIAPKQYKAVSNGNLISENEFDNNKITHWKHRYPIATYLICFAVTNYENFSIYVPLDSGDSIKISNYVYPEYFDEAKKRSLEIIPVMQFFNRKFGSYPFAKEGYGQAQFSWSGGMEHQTMTFLRDFSFELVTHELAHSWFGNYITCGTWHDIWLNEGFATYLTGLVFENRSKMDEWPRWKANTINKITKKPDGSVYVLDTASVDRIFDGRLSYAKGAMLLHLIRWEMGDSAFYTAINDYLNDPKLAYKFAYTDDLKNHLKHFSNINFNDLFYQWLYGEGYPSFSVYWHQDRNNMFHLIINQNTTGSTLPYFTTKLPILLKGLISDTVLVIESEQNIQTINLKLNQTIYDLVIDPDKWIISANNQVFHLQFKDENDQFFLFPNPVKNLLQVAFREPVKVNCISIFDLNGKKVIENCSPGMQQLFFVDVETLQNGIYFIKVNLEKGIALEKFIKLNK